ncbi:RNA-directed DNA polymerase, eukaryota [Tanacetum coccineum]
MGDANPIRTLGDYSKPSHEGYMNTIELPVGNNVVPLRSDTIRLVQNGCSLHGLRSEDPNQHFKDFLKRVDSLDLDGSITTWEDLATHFLAQFFPPRRTAKLLPHHGIDLWLQVQILHDHVTPTTRRTIDQSTGGKLRDRNTEESWALLEDLSLYDNESWNDPKDFAKPVKAISLPQDVPSTSDHRLIELENQVQRLMEAHLAPMQPTQVNKVTSSCEICSGPHDTQYCMKNPEQAFVEYASSRTDEAGDLRGDDRPQKPLNPNTNVPQKYGSKKDADHRNGSTGSHQKKGGKVYMVRAKELFTWTPSFESIKEHDYSSEDESVQGLLKTVLWEKSSQSWKHSVHVDKEISADPFGLNDLLGLKKPVEENLEPSPSLSHPPGFSPVGSLNSSDKELNKEFSPTISAKSKKEWVKELSNNNKLNFIAIQETKMEKVSHMDVKFMWGNSNYDYVFSEAAGNSGGILCIWEESFFKKDYVTISDSFVAIYGTWILKWRVTTFTSLHPILVKKAFKDHYEARFNKPTKARLKLSFSFPNRLSTDQVVDLERHVSHDEIRLAVWDCGVNKSPGPDGFTFEFFRKFWKVIGPDFCEAVEHFFKQGSFSKGCNSSFIALIPKVLDAKFVNDYRPISLIGCIYKVVTKILASRLAMVIAGLVSNTQSAFVAERQILDGPFILNEVLDWCKRKKKKALFFKVDFAKAYDSVRWDFLLDVLEAFGFGSTWCTWIRGISDFAKASLLVNGSPSDEFHIHRGLKQGDPLSPFLFILVMEALHLSVCKAVDEDVFKGIQLQGSLALSHLFYG